MADPSLNVVRKSAMGGLEAPAGEPCGRCGVRADVGCRHRPAAGVPPLAIVTSDPPRKDLRVHNQGLHFYRKDIASNLQRGAALLGLGPADDRRG
jgi:hypothetical protein